MIDGDGSVTVEAAQLRGDRAGVGRLLAAGHEPVLSFVADPVIVRVLVEAGADVDRPGPSGDRPIEAAAGLGMTSVVRELLDLGAAVTERAVAAAQRRGWSGVLRALSSGRGASSLADLTADEVAAARHDVVRLVSGDRGWSIAFQTLLVEWEVAHGEVVARRWVDLGCNEATWVEHEPAAGPGAGLALVATRDTGIIAVDAADWTVVDVPTTDDHGPGDRAGARQVLAVDGRRVVVPAARTSPWGMQATAAAVGGGPTHVLRLREGPPLGEDVALDLELTDAAGVDTLWRWTLPGQPAFVPAALAFGGRDTAAIRWLAPTARAACALVHVAADGAPASASVHDLGPSRRPPGLQAVAVLDHGDVVATVDGRLTRLSSSGEVTVDDGLVVHAVDALDGRVALATETGVQLTR